MGKIVHRFGAMVLTLVLVMALSSCGGSKGGDATKGAAGDKDAPAAGQKSVKISATGIGSTLHTVGVGMADIISKTSTLSATVVSTGGADAALRQLRDNRAEFSITNNDATLQAFLGKEQFSTEGKIPVRLIGQGQTTVRTILARADSRIKSIADLKGKPFAARRPSELVIERYANAVLKAHGVDPKEVKFVETADVAQCTQAIQQGSVKAGIIPGGIPTATILNLAQSVDLVFLSVDEPDKQKAILDEMGPAFKWETVPAGTYRGQNNPFNAISESVVLVTRADIPDDMVYEFTKAIYSNYDSLKLVHNTAKAWTVENALKDPAVPYHPGAIRYFKEIGAWNEAMDKIQQELLK